jgi:hypothetical protein
METSFDIYRDNNYLEEHNEKLEKSPEYIAYAKKYKVISKEQCCICKSSELALRCNGSEIFCLFCVRCKCGRSMEESNGEWKWLYMDKFYCGESCEESCE